MVIARIAEDTRGTVRAVPVPIRPPSAGTRPFPVPSTRRTDSTMAARCSGRVPQHPPTILTPKSFTNSARARAIGSGSSGYTASPTPVLIGSPALGITEIGCDACCDR